jgi:uncharacterized protein
MTVSAYLLDVNLLVALLWPSHSQHDVAVRWFARHRSSGWATCPITQTGFVRVVSNPAFSRDAPSASQAFAVLKVNLDAVDHRFWPDAWPYGETVAACGVRVEGHQQVTDAYLLGLALKNGGLLATFDAGIATLLKRSSVDRNAVVLLR